MLSGKYQNRKGNRRGLQRESMCVFEAENARIVKGTSRIPKRKNMCIHEAENARTANGTGKRVSRKRK